MDKLYRSISVSPQERLALRELFSRLGLDPVFTTASGRTVVLASERQFTYISLGLSTVRVHDLDAYERSRLDYYLARAERREAWRQLY